jgi:hypothetical protein
LISFSLGLVALTSWKLLSGPLLAYGDLTAYPNESSAFVARFHDAWLDRGLGSPTSAPPAYLVSALLLEAVGGNATLAQHIYIVAWIPLGFVGMAVFIRKWLPTSWTVAVLGGVLYVTTPIAIGLQIAGAAGLVWSYAVLPLVLYSAECVKQRGPRESPKLAMALSFFVLFSPELIVLGFLVCAIWLVVGSERLKPALGYACALILAFLCTLPAFVGRFEGEQLSDRLLEKAVADAEYTYSSVTPATLARLAGNHGDPMDALGYNTEALWTIPGYLLLIAFAYGRLTTRSAPAITDRLAVLFGAAMATLLAYASVSRVAPEFFEAFTPALLFRNPQKISLVLAASLCAGAAYGLSRLEKQFRAPRLVFPVVATLIVVGVYGSYVRPSIGGDWGVERVRGEAFRAQEHYLDAAQYLKMTDPQVGRLWRVAWLPLSPHDALTLEWTLPRWANEPVLESTDPNAQSVTDVLNASMRRYQADVFHLVGDRAAVRYIVVVRSSDSEASGPQYGEVKPELLRALDSDSRLRRVRTSSGFVIWRNLTASPLVRPIDSLLAVVQSDRVGRVDAVTERNLLAGGIRLNHLKQWATFPASAFTTTSSLGAAPPVIRVEADGVDEWPVMSRRVPVIGGVSYALSARIRVQNVAEAHAKVIWYLRRDDSEEQALRHDYARPVLNGTHGWSAVASGSITAPILARFAEVQFLAGRPKDPAAPPAVSWISDLALEHQYLGREPSRDPRRVMTALSLAVPSPGTATIIDSVELSRLLREETHVTSMPTTVVLINPTPSTLRQAESLVTGAEETRAVFEAPDVLQPVSGVWRVDHSTLGVASTAVTDPATAEVPLSLPPGMRGSITIVGCNLRGLKATLVSPTSVKSLRTSSPRERCDPVTIPSMAFPTGTTLALSAHSGSSLRAVRIAGRTHGVLPAASSNTTPRLLAEAPRNLRADGSQHRGFVLSESYNRGWRSQSPEAVKFRADLSFNGFILTDPDDEPRFAYAPQRSRDLLLAASLLSWLGSVAAFGWFSLWRNRSPRSSIG